MHNLLVIPLIAVVCSMLLKVLVATLSSHWYVIGAQTRSQVRRFEQSCRQHSMFCYSFIFYTKSINRQLSYRLLCIKAADVLVTSCFQSVKVMSKILLVENVFCLLRLFCGADTGNDVRWKKCPHCHIHQGALDVCWESISMSAFVSKLPIIQLRTVLIQFKTYPYHY